MAPGTDWEGNMHRWIARMAGLGGVCAVSFALAPTASAATKTVYAGLPKGAAKKVLLTLPRAEGLAVKGANPDANAFIIPKVTIHAGDSVQWNGLAANFHTVDLPGASGQDLPLFVADPAHLIAGANDAAGNPFWFNGQPTLGFDPLLFSATGGHVYDGSKRVDSGLPAGTSAKPFTVKFTKPGTYVYFCDVHANMKGIVVVRPRSATVPSAKQDAATLNAVLKADIRSAVKLTKVSIPADTVQLGRADGKGVEFLKMFPATLRVKAGTTVTFTMARGTREVHTAAFGPPKLLTALSNSLGGPAPSQQALFPSDSPALGPIQLSPTAHGNGFVNTGALDADSTTPNQASSRIKFTAPGTYKFICLIHSFMHGTIVVK